MDSLSKRRPGGPRRYALNESFFNVIDTPEKAYILGLLAADGYVDEKGYALTLSLKRDDRSTLLKVATALYDGATIYMDRKKALADAILRTEYKQQDWSELTGDDLLRLHAEEGSWRAVARRLGIPSYSYFMLLKKKLGIAREKSDWSGLTLDELEALHRQHGSWQQVAKAKGMGACTIFRVLRRLGARRRRST